MKSIKELALEVTTEMESVGYTQSTICTLYLYALLPLIKFHADNGTENYDPWLVAEYIRNMGQRYSNGDITRGTYKHRVSGVDKLVRLYETGKMLWKPARKGSRYKSSEYYENLIDGFIESSGLRRNTCDDAAWVARNFFWWLGQNGHDNLTGTGATEIQRYVVHCSEYMTSTSVYNVLLYMRKLCEYLHERGLLENAYTALLSMRVSRESKMYPAARHDEVAVVLEQIDRSTVMGKRDYAVILLGAVIGLRAIDIRCMKLSDIDWQRGEVRIIQSKTGNMNVLPLTADVGDALKDYILHARPNSVDDNVFIRLRPPYVAVKDAWSIGDIYDRYRKRAGLDRKAFDGKGFHSLRRALGKNMTTAGVALTSTAQVLGDADFDSAKKYIALDSEHLAECALDFSGIEISGGGVSE